MESQQSELENRILSMPLKNVVKQKKLVPCVNTQSVFDRRKSAETKNEEEKNNNKTQSKAKCICVVRVAS